MSETTAIRTRSLTKRYGELRAVDAVDLDVREGDVYGFLGANGSGKTTTVRILLGLVLPTSGETEVLGQPMPAARRTVLPLIGALVEQPGAYPHLSGAANLSLLDATGPNSLRGERRAQIGAVLERVGLDPADRRPTRAYSLGMRQRLGLAAALLRRPRLLVLDEPTNGLDPQGITEIRRLLLELNAEGTTIFLSSHLLAEIEQMCTRVGVLDRGRLVLQEQLDALLRPTGLVEVRTPDAFRCASLLGNAVVSVEGQRLLVTATDPAALNAFLVTEGVRVAEVAPYRRDLERVVLDAAASERRESRALGLDDRPRLSAMRELARRGHSRDPR
jgi:ABC-2 type transport system ATP-binding protein